MLLIKGERTYSDEQLIAILKNFPEIHPKMLDIFKQIAKGNAAMHELAIEGVGNYVRDKCVAALLLPGLIKRTGNGTEKRCELTPDGKAMYELIMSLERKEEENKNEK